MEYTKEQIQAMKNLIMAYNFLSEYSRYDEDVAIIGESIRVLSEPMKEQLSKNKIDIPSA